MDIIDYRTINLNRINFAEPIKVKGNCLLTKSTYSYNNSQIPIYIQSPKMTSINGIVMNETRSYIELEISKSHVGFYDFINKIDEHNIHITYTNSEEWFEQKLPMDVIDDFYNSAIKTKMNSLPTIKFKVPIYKNKKGCDIFSENGIPIEPKLVKKNTDVICILELTGIKYFKHRFECEWNVVQLKAFTNENVVRECMINEELLSDNEESEESDYCIEEKKNKVNVIKVESPTLECKEETVLTEKLEEPEEMVETEGTYNVETEGSEGSNNNVETEGSEGSNNNVETEGSEGSNNNVETEGSEGSNNNVETEGSEGSEGSNNNIETEGSEGQNNVETVGSEDSEGQECLEESEEEDSDIESDVELEELRDLDNLEEVELEEPENETKDIDELMAEINHLKQSALEKDEEVNNLKNKYKNLYQELNL